MEGKIDFSFFYSDLRERERESRTEWNGLLSRYVGKSHFNKQRLALQAGIKKGGSLESLRNVHNQLTKSSLHVVTALIYIQRGL